ncbi:hypothetical protein F4779DRAFT_622253 [Xylariaceae sp. FL0662B]|nr:hypothetical protein F4779DRAFT_622253 [Xylariaceae sp. FL0662B]
MIPTTDEMKWLLCRQDVKLIMISHWSSIAVAAGILVFLFLKNVVQYYNPY